MNNENPSEKMNKEQILALLINFKELHKKIKPRSLHGPCSTDEGEHMSWFHLITEINKLDPTKTIRNFHFSQDEIALVTDVFKIAKENAVSSKFTLAFMGIRIPR